MAKPLSRNAKRLQMEEKLNAHGVNSPRQERQMRRDFHEHGVPKEAFPSGDEELDALRVRRGDKVYR